MSPHQLGAPTISRSSRTVDPLGLSKTRGYFPKRGSFDDVRRVPSYCWTEDHIIVKVLVVLSFEKVQNTIGFSTRGRLTKECRVGLFYNAYAHGQLFCETPCLQNAVILGAARTSCMFHAV